MFWGRPSGGLKELGGVFAVCTVIFFADASHSTAIPTFPFYAKSLGASVAMVGVLASATGLSTMIFSMPLGLLSDRFGRRPVMLLGMLCFAIAPIAYNLSTNPVHLLPARVILGVAMAATFSIGFVYVSEVAPPGRRNMAQGLYMTFMGIGFTLGPLVGGLSAKALGYYASFYLSSGFGFAGLILLLLLRDSTQKSAPESSSRDLSSGFRQVLTNSKIVAAGTANFFNSLLYNATMVYFPLYGGSIGFDEPQVGLSLAVRGLVSTASRIPAGGLAKRFNVLRLMALGLLVSAATLFVLPTLDGLVVVGIILGIQGAAYGLYLTSGNIFITEEAPEGQRGASIGVYSTFSNISGVVSPILLGVISEAWDFQGAFRASAALAICGTVLTLGLSAKRRS